MIRAKRRLSLTCTHEKLIPDSASSIPNFTFEKHWKQVWPKPTFQTYYAGKGKYIKNKFYTSVCKKCGYTKAITK